MDGIGLVSTASVTSAGQIGPTSSIAGIKIKVFDLAVVTTGGVISLFAGTSSTGVPLLTVWGGVGTANANPYIHSEVGYTFEAGCYARVVGCSGKVNYYTIL